MESLWHDLRYALRTFHRDTGFTLAVLLTLSLGIGANAAIFTVGARIEPMAVLREE